VQAIGGVNEKVEGFFDLCREQGLSGKQGVCIPAANERHLILRHDVVAAIHEGTFHVWSVEHVDEAIQLFTGIETGDIAHANSFHGRVDKRLQEMLAAVKEQPASSDRSAITAQPAPEPERDPRPPLPGRDA
jgi:predicted ATP-dependent protease